MGWGESKNKQTIVRRNRRRTKGRRNSGRNFLSPFVWPWNATYIYIDISIDLWIYFLSTCLSIFLLAHRSRYIRHTEQRRCSGVLYAMTSHFGNTKPLWKSFSSIAYFTDQNSWTEPTSTLFIFFLLSNKIIYTKSHTHREPLKMIPLKITRISFFTRSCTTYWKSSSSRKMILKIDFPLVVTENALQHAALQ